MQDHKENPFQVFSRTSHCKLAAAQEQQAVGERTANTSIDRPMKRRNSTSEETITPEKLFTPLPKRLTRSQLKQAAEASKITKDLEAAGLLSPSPPRHSAVQASESSTHYFPETTQSMDVDDATPKRLLTPKNAKGSAIQEKPKGMPEKLGDPIQPLRMIIIGHNPSETTWRVGHAYAHPSNHMWRLLIKTGIAPPGITGAWDDDKLPALAGVGFSDVGTGHVGTESAAFKSSVFVSWSQNFYDRMKSHIAQASAAVGCVCGQCGAPAMVAFSGKRHFMELLNMNKKGKDKVKFVPFGRLERECIPPNWPFPEWTEVWVCSSTSGASPMTNEEREAPYRAVAERLTQVPWPRIGIVKCCRGCVGAAVNCNFARVEGKSSDKQ